VHGTHLWVTALTLWLLFSRACSNLYPLEATSKLLPPAWLWVKLSDQPLETEVVFICPLSIPASSTSRKKTSRQAMFSSFWVLTSKVWTTLPWWGNGSSSPLHKSTAQAQKGYWVQRPSSGVRYLPLLSRHRRSSGVRDAKLIQQPDSWNRSQTHQHSLLWHKGLCWTQRSSRLRCTARKTHLKPLGMSFSSLGYRGLSSAIPTWHGAPAGTQLNPSTVNLSKNNCSSYKEGILTKSSASCSSVSFRCLRNKEVSFSRTESFT